MFVMVQQVLKVFKVLRERMVQLVHKEYKALRVQQVLKVFKVLLGQQEQRVQQVLKDLQVQ